jgi:hypothetical protein
MRGGITRKALGYGLVILTLLALLAPGAACAMQLKSVVDLSFVTREPRTLEDFDTSGSSDRIDVPGLPRIGLLLGTALRIVPGRAEAVVYSMGMGDPGHALVALKLGDDGRLRAASVGDWSQASEDGVDARTTAQSDDCDDRNCDFVLTLAQHATEMSLFAR